MEDRYIKRHHTRSIKIGNIFIGSDHPIAIQSMNNTNTEDVDSTVKQLHSLEKAGCDIGRIAIPNMRAAQKIREIKSEISIPLVADIHFDHRLALASIDQGIDKIRINPGNIGGIAKTKEVIAACKEKSIPVRIGVNSGSLEKDIVQKYGGVNASGLVESMLRNIDIFLEEDFHDIILSLKASNVCLMLEAYQKISQVTNYPLHLGVTESGSIKRGTIKSSVGIGALLSQGLGDTLRVSLTGDVVEEIFVANQILSSLGLSKSPGIELISCPTCGRTKVELANIVDMFEIELSKYQFKKSVRVAIMGCAVNGPGEAKEADFGIAAGKSEFLFFKKGISHGRVPEREAVEFLVNELKDYIL